MRGAGRGAKSQLCESGTQTRRQQRCLMSACSGSGPTQPSCLPWPHPRGHGARAMPGSQHSAQAGLQRPLKHREPTASPSCVAPEGLIPIPPPGSWGSLSPGSPRAHVLATEGPMEHGLPAATPLPASAPALPRPREEVSARCLEVAIKLQ